MNQRVVLPFIYREASVSVNEETKIHCNEATGEGRSIWFEKPKLRIPLELKWIVSGSKTYKPD